ncbi:MAG: Rod binding domain-containing protein [Polyangiales bacterium]
MSVIGDSGGLANLAMPLAESPTSNLRTGTATERAGTPEAAARTDAAQQFESLLVQQLWQTMRKTVSGAGFGGGSAGADTYMHFMDEAIATQMTEAGGIGIRQVLDRAMGGEAYGMGSARSNGLGQMSGAAAATTRRAPLELGPLTGQRMPGATGRLQGAARELLSGASPGRFAREGRLTQEELSSDFETQRPDGTRAAFNVEDAAGFDGEYKCNIFAFELARRAGFQTPVQGRSHGWGYPSPDAVTADAATGRLRQDWGRVVTGEPAASIDEGLQSGARGLMLTGSGRDGHAGHMAVVERVHSIQYDDAGEVEQVVFDGWEARTDGARHLSQRTWNRAGVRGGNDVRRGLDRIEMIELLAPRGGAPEIPITRGAGPSRHD